MVLLTNFVGRTARTSDWPTHAPSSASRNFFRTSLRRSARHSRRTARADRGSVQTHGFPRTRRARDRRLYYVAKIPWHKSFLPLLADELVRHINTGLGRICKCLVLDLDNTLWGGVLGEDGAMGVRIGMDDRLYRGALEKLERARQSASQYVPFTGISASQEVAKMDTWRGRRQGLKIGSHQQQIAATREAANLVIPRIHFSLIGWMVDGLRIYGSVHEPGGTSLEPGWLPREHRVTSPRSFKTFNYFLGLRLGFQRNSARGAAGLCGVSVATCAELALISLVPRLRCAASLTLFFVLLQHVKDPDDKALLRSRQRLEALHVAHRAYPARS